MNGNDEPLDEATAHPAGQPGAPWPPPMASRAVRRHCVHLVKSGYCVVCGTRVAR